MAYDLSTYEGRQEFRDAGGYVTGTGDGGMEIRNPGSSETTYSGTPSAPGAPGTVDEANIDLQKMIWDQAQAKATQAYNTAMLNHEGDKLAFERAKQAFNESIQAAQMTGLWNGQASLPALMGYATQFGQWGTPQQGQKTLTAEQQAFNQAIAAAGLTGSYQGAQTQQAQQQAFLQGLQQQQEARLLQGQQQQTSLGYLQQLGQMRGPQNYFQYQNVLGATPQGMKDLVAAAMGQYIPGGGATTGVQPVAQSLQGMYGDITGQGYGAPPGQVPGQAGAGGVPGTAGGGYGTQVYQQQQAATAAGLPAPNQIAPQAWANMAPSQRALLTSAYESQGWNAEDVKGLFEQSLPKYGAKAPGAGQFKLV